MKLLWFLAVGVLDLPFTTVARSASLGIKETLLADSPHRTVSFAALPFDLPSNTLLSEGVAMHAALQNEQNSTILGPDGRIACTESETAPMNHSVAVVLAFSKCLNDTALGMVEQWVNQVKSSILATISENITLTFQSTMVSGACQERSEKTIKGLSDDAVVTQKSETSTVPPSMLLADQVHPNDFKRLEAFPALGEVVDLANEDVSLAIKPIAVISFVTGEKSYGEVMQYEASVHVSKTFNFQICKQGSNCDGVFENCIYLEEVVDLFMYNPFTVTRSLQCSHLDDGVPVTYLDAEGARQCFCNCPAGYEMGENEYGNPACKKVIEEPCPCVWAECNGFKHKVETNEAVCAFTDVATKWGLPVPFPTDGYVADKRDTLSEGYKDPRITLTVLREQNAEYQGTDIRKAVGTAVSIPLTFAEIVGLYPGASRFSPVVAAAGNSTTHDEVATWKEYQLHRDAHINDIKFTSYGKYSMKVSAYDYFSSATCSGCLVIVDNNRPTATTTCPRSFCDTVVESAHCAGSAELTTANLEKANSLAAAYFDFADKAINDACSIENRCDTKSFKRQNFFESGYSDRELSKAQECFAQGKVIDDLLQDTHAKTNPLVRENSQCDNTVAPVPAGQCTRCCKMQTALKEWWTDYRCGSNFDARYCDGASDQTCEYSQCLVMNGDTLATVTASITQEAKTESESVLAQVEDQAYQTVTQIHRSLDCTAFGASDGTCDFRAKLSELIDTTEQLNFGLTSGSTVASDYVFWRTKLAAENESWQLWKTAQHVEYGQVIYENDDVLTFSNPETKIILEAWTQCGLVRRFFFYVHLHVNSPVSVCEKFSDMWYQTSVSRLPIGTGMCAYPGSDFAELTFDFHPNAGLQYSRQELRMKVSKVECTGALQGRQPVDILSVTQDSPEIVSRFAVTMVNKATTIAATNFHVECVFTYKKYSGATDVETCTRDFSISDCKGPAFDTPNAVCEYNACAGNEKAGLYEACGGNVVKSDETKTMVESGDKACCQGCGDNEITCTALLDLPNSEMDIKRCEPSSPGVYSSNKNSYGAVLLTKAAREYPTATALFGATALIAVVALVVVRRQVIATQSAQVVDDAYYPLLH